MEAKLPGLVGNPLRTVVSELGLEESSFHFVDEPPGKLKVIRVESPAEIEVHLRYDAATLFSDKRGWPLERIGGAEVIGLVWRSGDRRRVFGVIHERLSMP